MASFFRSIGTKIFGIAVGLLILMVAASLLSGMLAAHVHRQLMTLSYSLFPLTVTLGELRSNVLAQRVEIEDRERGRAGEAECRRISAARSRISDQLIARAEALRARGVELAVLERNRLKLARMEPLIDEIAYEQGQLQALLTRQCATPVGSTRAAEIDGEIYRHADALARRAGAITREIDVFVTEGVRIVGQNQQLAQRATVGLIGVSGLVGLLLAYIVTRGLTQPILRLRTGARAVQSGHLDGEVAVTSADEIGDVTVAFNEMVAGLRAKEHIKATFGQFVDPRIVSELLDGGAEGVSSGVKQVATLYFSDLVGFTSISERLAPSTVVTLVNAYFTEMSHPIRERHGIIDKYLGDGIMAFWIPTFTEAGDQATMACAAALEQFERLAAFRGRVPDLIGLRRDVPIIDMRVGLATGEVVVGSIGSDIARSFTVMGDTVNFGSRLEAVNKVYGTHILIDETTREMAGAAIEVREVDLVAVVGREEPIRVFELAALAGGLPPERRELFDLYALGLARYRAGDWKAAEQAFHKALARAPDDGPSQVMLDRALRFRAAPPSDWAGAWRLKSK
jgi:class 3 adenylate cyclase